MGGPEGDDNFATERGWGYYVYLTDETVWNRTAQKKMENGKWKQETKKY